jgi:hypothetical protein
MKPPSRILLLLAVLITIVAPCARALAESEATAGRLLARRYGDAIVTVKGSVYMTINIGLRKLPETERKIDVSGTMISAAGLTLTSLSTVDPREIFESMRGQFNTGGDSIDLGKTDFRDMRIVLADGKEIPVNIVFRDKDHDMVLLAPTKSEPGMGSFTYVDLGQATESAVLLGKYFHFSRAGQAFQRTLIVRECTVIGIIERPHRFFMVSTDIYPDTLGCPVFAANGHVLGICLNNIFNGHPSGTMVVPATDLEAAITQGSPSANLIP